MRQCRFCGRWFKNFKAIEAHLKHCEARMLTEMIEYIGEEIEDIKKDLEEVKKRLPEKLKAKRCKRCGQIDLKGEICPNCGSNEWEFDVEVYRFMNRLFA